MMRCREGGGGERSVAEVSCTAAAAAAAQLSGGRWGHFSLSPPFAAMQTAVKVMPVWPH